MWWIVLVVGALVLGYCYLIRPHKYWVARGVKQGNPGFILGDNWGPMLQRQSFTDMVQMLYNVAPNARYSGFYQLLMPTLLLRDPDLIKQITVKDFDHFVDHRTLIPEESEPLMAKNLFQLKGKKWRDMRSNLSPAFTSSKMKYMFSLISQSGQKFIQHFLKNDEEEIVIEMKDVFTRFTNDVIAKTAFGVECDSLTNRDNEFYLMGKDATNFGVWKFLKCFGYLLVPRLFKMLKITIFSKEVRAFFYRLVKTNIESREKHGIVSPDMIGLLVQARKHGLKHDESQSNQDAGFATVEESETGRTSTDNPIEITDEDITAQAMVFFFGGFDSVASLMCFMSHELAVNPDVQERLIQEVDETRKACGGQLTYDALFSMKYLDMVTSETLRKWPGSMIGDRICTKSYTISPKYPDERPLRLEPNDSVWIPIYGIHRDPRYYPDPERFNPERFSEENKGNIKPYTYLPFGAGPRNCIASRFALLETKTLFFHILAHFQIVPVEKTQIPLALSKKVIHMTAEKGFWLGLKRRT